MYFEPWQVFLVGCIVGTLISFIILSIIVINTIGRIGFRGIHIQYPQTQAQAEQKEPKDKENDINAKLSYILFTRGFITQSDIDFMLDKITFDEWEEALSTEIDDLKSSKKDED